MPFRWQLPTLVAASLALAFACTSTPTTGTPGDGDDSGDGDESGGDGDTSGDGDTGDGDSGDGDSGDGDTGDGDTGDGDTGDGDTGDGDSGDGDTGDGDTPGDGDTGDGDTGDGDTGDGDTGDGDSDASVPPGPDDPADGPGAASLLQGVWNQPFDFKMTNYPITWAIAVVHSSMLYRSIGINYSPNAVMSIAIKESALSCRNENPQNAQESMAVKDGCFQIEAESAYKTLEQLFPQRFAAGHANLISGKHFESAALATVYYSLFSLARFRDYRAEPGDPQAFFDSHPDPQAAQKVLCGAYNRGLWWDQLDDIFKTCRTSEVTGCFGGHAIAIYHASKIAEYTEQLDKTTPFDARIDMDDLEAYWESIKQLYPDADEADAKDALQKAFDQYRGGESTISFHERIRQVLAALIEVLPKVPTQDQAAKSLCDLQQLNTCD